jgi:uncharacterized membrane protein
MFGKTRMEAFSDGVFAIIITIMVLELKAPEGNDWEDLKALWPTFVSYVVSFAYVGIYWTNHHHLLQATRKVNGMVLWANLYLLFWLSLFPFVTSWAGESGFEAAPLMAYSAVALMSGAAYALVYHRILVADPTNPTLAKAVGNAAKEKISLASYTLAFLAPLAGHVGTLVCRVLLLGVAAMWLIPDRRIERVMGGATGEEPGDAH